MPNKQPLSSVFRSVLRTSALLRSVPQLLLKAGTSVGILATVLLLLNVSAALAQAPPQGATIGGSASYNAGGWGSFNVVDHQIVGFDIVPGQESVRIDTTTILKRLDCDNNDKDNQCTNALLKCKVDTGGDGCHADRTEQVRIDGELPWSSTQYFLYIHSDEFRVNDESDYDHKNTYDLDNCAGIPGAAAVTHVPGTETRTATCIVRLPPGHHTLELNVGTGLGNGFASHPEQYSETVSATISPETPVPAACAKPPLTHYPTEISPLTITDSSGWSFEYLVSEQHGLEIDNVTLQSRRMAAKLSVPYFTVSTSSLPDEVRCTLTATSNPASKTACATHLISLHASDPGTNPTEVKAVYEVDNLPFKTSNSCLLITQDYQFFDPQFGSGPGGPCEPTSSLPCAIFKPLVSYLFASTEGEHLKHIALPERLFFSVQPFDPDGPYQVALPPQAAAFTRDRDYFNPAAPVIPVGPTSPTTSPRYTSLAQEFLTTAIASGGTAGEADNYHQTSNKQVQLPIPPPGCPECAHIHWRWGTWLSHAYGPQWNYGKPFIPEGSHQQVKVAAVKYRLGEEDPNNFADLVNGESLISPFDPVVFWYGGEGFQDTDTFFMHGGFFSPGSSSLSSITAQFVASSQTAAGVESAWRLGNTGTISVSGLQVTNISAKPIGSSAFVAVTGPQLPLNLGTLDGSDSAVCVFSYNPLCVKSSSPFTVTMIVPPGVHKIAVTFELLGESSGGFFKQDVQRVMFLP